MFSHNTDAVRPTVAELKAVLVDDLKVLKAIVDNARKAFSDYNTILERDLGTKEFHIPPALAIVCEWLGRGQGMGLWDIMRDAYSHGPAYEFPEPEKRAQLRELKRLVNLAARVATQLLGDVTRVAPYYRMEVAQQAYSMISSFCGSFSPNGGPHLYRNPDAGRWLGLRSRAQRRIAEVWLQQARDDDERAAKLNPMALPAKLEGGVTWSDLEKFGFVLVAGQDVAALEVIQVCLPVQWSLDHSRGPAEVRLLDRERRHRLSLIAAADGNPPVLRLMPRYVIQVVKTTDQPECWWAYNVYDAHKNERRPVSEYKAAPNAEGRAAAEQWIAGKLAQDKKYTVAGGWPHYS